MSEAEEAGGSSGTLARVEQAGGILARFEADATLEEVLATFLAGKAARTLAAYADDLRDFGRYLDGSSVDEAVALLIRNGAPTAHRVVLAYRASLLDRRLSPATVNRRLSALRSLVKMAGMMGVVAWSLQIPGVRQAVLKDTRGPGTAGFRRLLRAAAAQDDARKATRDVAMARLLHDLGLRRAELVALDVGHLELEAEPAAIWVLGKGTRERVRLTLPAPTVAALRAWLGVRGAAPSPAALFLNFDRAAKGDGRLSGSGVYKILAGLGRSAGVKVRPHGLRHTAITTALERAGEMGIPIEEVLSFSRHAPGSLKMLLVYRDSLTDRQGELAGMVAGL